MPSYILLSSVTAEGGKTLHANPDRMVEVNSEIEGLGCKVVAQYAVLGEIDFVTIVEAPDNAAIAHLSIALASRGTIKITSLAAIPIPELIKKLKGPQQMSRRKKK
jgi:uncharacterized protein with GYD domain